jgi:hypothetical protein
MVYPGSGPSTPEVTPLLPALFLFIFTVVTTLLELFCLEEEEEGSISPSLRVQTPLYRRGSGYRLGGRLPSCRLLRGCVLGMILWLSDDGNFIKCLSPLGAASWRHMLSLLPQILSWGRLLLAGWWSSDMAGVTPVPRFCRSCRGEAAFGEAAVGGVLSFLSTLALHGGAASRLLAQPAPWTKPVFLT